MTALTLSPPYTYPPINPTFLSKKGGGGKCQLNDKNNCIEDFPGGPGVKNPPARAGAMGSVPGPGRFHVPQSN